MSSTARMLDANANRAREALRVLEDVARFDRNDQRLCAALKEFRHQLQAALSVLPEGWLDANRDVSGDVGTSVSTDSEMHRGGLLEIVIAAAKRLGESLRVIEELLKTIDRHAAKQIESIRYRAYDISAQLQLQLGTGQAKQWRLCLLLTMSLCRRPWREVLRAALDNGCDCVQIREKELAGGDLVKHAREVMAAARPSGVAVIINDRVDVALACNAQGVHLGQRDLSVREARRITGRSLMIGVSTHNLDEAQAAVIAGADYCGVGMMFHSSLKPDLTPSGPAYLRDFLLRFPSEQLPHLAIGGITASNVSKLVELGCRGVAVSSGICSVDDPAAATRGIIEQLESATSPIHA